MSQADSTTKIDAYLDLIEARERKSRNRRLSLFALLLLVGGVGGVFLVWKFLSGPEMEVYTLSEMDLIRAEEILTEQPSGFIVSYPAIGMMDTIRSVQGFANFRSIVESLNNPDLMAGMVSDVDNDGESGLSQGLPMFIVDVSGKREAGEKLSFRIENYDEAVSYLIDFGNGVRRTMRERTTYTYPRQGRFTMKLLASAADRGNSVYAKEFRIAQTSPKADNQSVILAANTDLATPATSEAAAPALDSVETASLDLDITDLEATPAATDAEDEIPSSFVASAGEELVAVADEEPAATPEVLNTPTPGPPPASPASMAPLIASEILPEYPGGTKALARYFRRNASYPRQARVGNIEGVVYVRFVVNADGSLSNPMIVKGLGYGCDEEALRLVRNMPAWIPGEQNGEAVPVYQSVPVTFKLVK